MAGSVSGTSGRPSMRSCAVIAVGAIAGPSITTNAASSVSSPVIQKATEDTRVIRIAGSSVGTKRCVCVRIDDRSGFHAPA
jgi:hypothetical protein